MNAKQLLSGYQAQLDQYFALPQEADTALCKFLHAHFAPQQMQALLQALLQDSDALQEISARSYMHGNGFLKVVLVDRGYKLRLHIWFAGQSCEENIHDHRWSFASLILNGALHSEIWQDHAAGQLFDQYLYYAAQKGQVAEKHYEGLTQLQCTAQLCHHAGQSYVMPKGKMHRIINPGHELVATMMCSAPTDQGSNRLIPTHQGIDPNIQPPKITPAQLRLSLQQYLKHLNKIESQELLNAA